jgi:2-keto-3-deoxy-L-rhamnonate aldolase RhmA
VEACESIAAVEGIDALFVGPADLAVCYGVTSMAAPVVRAAMARVAAAAQAAGKACMTFAPDAAACAELREIGVTAFCVASEHAWMLQGARATVAGIREIG